MKKILLILCIIFGTLIGQSREGINAIKGQKKGKIKNLPNVIINQSDSTLEWKGGLRFINNNHNGNLKIKTGVLFLDKDNNIAGNIIVNMQSMTSIDLPKSKKKYLIDHLKNEDFFDVELFPTASLKINKSKILEKKSDGKYRMEIYGDLTIKSITKPVVFTANADLSSEIKSANGVMRFNRSDFDIQYRNAIHLDDPKSFWNDSTTTKKALKDKVIKDEIELRFDILSKVPIFLD